MSNAAVVFAQVSKKFRRGERHHALRDLIPSLMKRAARGEEAERLRNEEFWALKDVSFEVQPGEALGIIGPNGAGKSTTLKLLTRILKPTIGACHVRGRVGALIEIAAGFHPDLTGKENVYLQGAIMGMKRDEIAKKLDVIIDFAGTREFAETPLKRYSSGMNARLGFSIAAHLNPDVLLIDEVLAVGDLAFQQRCYERMHDFKRNGAAIVFISHNLPVVGALCDRVAVLQRGELVGISTPAQAFSTYARLGSAKSDGSRHDHCVEVFDTGGRPTTSVMAGSHLMIRATMRPPKVKGSVAFVLQFRRVETGEIVYLTTSPSVGCPPMAVADEARVQTEWTLHANLARGHYLVEVGVFELARRNEVVMAPSSPIFVQESQSESGTTYLDATCVATIRERQSRDPQGEWSNALVSTPE